MLHALLVATGRSELCNLNVLKHSSFSLAIYKRSKLLRDDSDVVIKCCVSDRRDPNDRDPLYRPYYIDSYTAHRKLVVQG